MTTETLIQKVREEVGELDERSRELLATAMKIIQSNDGGEKASAGANTFLSRNVSLEDYRLLPRPERRRYQSEAEMLNQRWIEERFQALEANWIMVIDGRIVKHGASLEDYPGDDEMRELRQQAGKIPFVFFSKFLLAIEEASLPWHKTTVPGDFYPTLSIVLSHSNNRSAVEADWDTGTIGCYGDLAHLINKGLVAIDPDDVEHEAHHLSQAYAYFTKEVLIEMVDTMGKSRRGRTGVICVDDWQRSPFVNINPHRTFLLGRKLLLNLRPRVTLDFDARQSEVEFKQQAS